MTSVMDSRNRSVILCIALIYLLAPSAGSLARARHSHASPVAPATTSGTPGKDPHEAECLTCHRALAGHYHDTAHAHTSRPARPDTVLGYSSENGNSLVVENAASSGATLNFRVIKRNESFWQTVVQSSSGPKEFRSERIDEVIGSGKRGQTYLYWRGDSLFELPLSWWRDGNQWINSPGYSDGTANFTRPVITRCLECHADSIQASSPAALNSRFDRTSLSYGVGCIRCHGDGSAHSTAERDAIAKGISHAPASLILNPGRFTRERQVDLCALCHSGQREQLQPAFTYTAGQPLDRYLRSSISSAVPDVHGNQVGLLQRSACYRSSPEMTCSTCHEVHAPGRPVETYNNRCLACHKVESCGRYSSIGKEIVNRCISCHMPVETAQSIVSQTAGETIRARIRTHWIRVYPP